MRALTRFNSRFMPPSGVVEGMDRIAIVFARLHILREDRGIRPFVVYLSKNGRMCKGVTSRFVSLVWTFQFHSLLKFLSLDFFPEDLALKPSIMQSQLSLMFVYHEPLCSEATTDPRTTETTSFLAFSEFRSDLSPCHSWQYLHYQSRRLLRQNTVFKEP